jgi:hypothetical protein
VVTYLDITAAEKKLIRKERGDVEGYNDNS